MTLEQVADKVVETDVLVIGGGMGGCCAAAKAADHGLKVTLAEKSKTDRSGSAGQGIDHLSGQLPRDGVTVLDLIKAEAEWMNLLNGDGRWANPNINYKLFSNMFWMLEEMEKLGITAKWDDGEYYWIPWVEYGGRKTGLRVHWEHIKPMLAKAVRKRGVKVLERTMVIDLLTNNGTVTGATAVNTRTGEFIVIKAKATVIATGNFARLYNPETPLFWKYKFRYHWCPATVSGDGWAMAYRAGAELLNMDITGWDFRVRDDLTISFGNFHMGDGMPSKLVNWKGEEVVRATGWNAAAYAKAVDNAQDPIYYSLEHLPDDYHKRMEVAYADERLVSFKIAEDRSFNPRTHWYDLMPNKPHNYGQIVSGIFIDEDFRTTLKGLYAVGDCAASSSGTGGSSYGGFAIGDHIHASFNDFDEPVVDEAQVASQKQTALAPMAVKDGTEPMELECAVRYICERYVSQFKSEGKLREGQRRLGSLRRVFLPRLMAKNPHYLLRCLEVRNIMDLAEVHIQGCLERKETRGSHIRLDYPETDPSRDNMLTFQRLENGNPILEIKEIPDLKPEYMKEAEQTT